MAVRIRVGVLNGVRVRIGVDVLVGSTKTVLVENIGNCVWVGGGLSVGTWAGVMPSFSPIVC